MCPCKASQCEKEHLYFNLQEAVEDDSSRSPGKTPHTDGCHRAAAEQSAWLLWCVNCIYLSNVLYSLYQVGTCYKDLEKHWVSWYVDVLMCWWHVVNTSTHYDTPCREHLLLLFCRVCISVMSSVIKKAAWSVSFVLISQTVFECVCPSGGFSDTYAALCDFNEMPSREEIQWVSHRCHTAWNTLMYHVYQRKKLSDTS